MHRFEEKIVRLDVTIICSMAHNITNCAQNQLGECVAAEVERSENCQYLHREILLDW